MTCSLKVKLCISLFSFILFLGMLEIGLRIVGYFTLRSRNRLSISSFEKELKAKQSLQLEIRTRDEDRTLGGNIPPFTTVNAGKNVYSILCVGDSYTYGGAVSFEETYPSLLQNMLDASDLPPKFKVYNGGICEYNSRQLLNRLPKFIKTYRPRIVVLLDGASNRYNFALYDMHGNTFMGFIKSLRIYKMAKIISLNLIQRSFKSKVKRLEQGFPKSMHVQQGEDGYLLRQPGSDWLDAHVFSIVSPEDVKTTYDKVRFYYNNGNIEEALSLCKTSLQENPSAVDLLSIMAYIYSKTNRIEEAQALHDQAFQIQPNSQLVSAYRAYFYENLVIHSSQDRKKSEIIEYCLKAIESDPFYGYPNYWALITVFKLQSKYDADYILDFFNGLIETHPALMESKLFLNYYNYFKNTQEWEGHIEKWLTEDLEKIVKLCKKNNITLIIQNYPYSYTMANQALKNTASTHSLDFVDNYSVFKKLINQANYNDYFYDDEHCTKKGHYIMAENVFHVLQQQFNSK